MYLRRCERRKNGKRHTYWALVESYRTARGSRQRVVAYLGELKPSEENGWAKLGAHLDEKTPARRPQLSLFDPPPDPVAGKSSEAEAVRVRLSGVKLERLRDFGDVWLAWGLWRMLGLDELLGVAPEKVHTDRLYAGLDRLLPHKETLEKHLRQRFGELFELKCDLLLYDITSTYFEGDMEGCPIAQRGYSRDSRGDRPQVCIGLVVTEEGFPLGYEVYAGNTHDSTTVQTIIEALEKKYGTLDRVWVMDRGMVSEANLKFLRKRGGKYIVGTPKQMLREFEQHLTEQDWSQAREGVEVKLVPAPEGDETFLLARSADRRAKELAMHEKFTLRMEEGLKKMQAAAEAGRLKEESLAGERLGRLKQRNWRASHAFDVTIKKIEPPRGKQRLEITWQRSAKFGDWAQLADGCYLLRSNLTDIDAATLWQRYIQLTEAEWAFRITKDELEIRPIWHHKEDRVQAHILVCFLAYALWKTLAGWMRGAGLGDAPRTLLEELAQIKSGDIVLPAQTSGGVEKTIRLRHVTEPDESQAVLLHRLGLTLPRRLRRFDNPTEPTT